MIIRSQQDCTKKYSGEYAFTDNGIDTGSWQFSTVRVLSFDGSVIAGYDDAVGASYRATNTSRL